MPSTRSLPTPAARTPFGALDEAGLHTIVGYQLAQASIATSQVYAAHVGGPFALRPVEFTILGLIDRNPGLTARQLATALAVTPPNITNWMDRLASRGWVARERIASDLRAQALHTTAAGAGLVRQALEALAAGEAQALAALSTAERGMLVELLHKVGRCRLPE